MRVSALATLFFSLSEFALASSCKKDNCLNAMSNHPSSASTFCAPYLATTQTATSGIPSFLSNCKASISRLSSACSCILTSTASTTTANPQVTCTATTTITALASTVNTTVTSGSTCPSTGTPNTITSVSVSTTTVTVTAIATATATALPTCFPHINGGDFTSGSQNLAAFTVTESPTESIFNEVLAPSAEGFLSVSDGTPQFLFLNYQIIPIPSQYTLAQYIGPICAPYTTITLSATINAGSSDGTLTFCINPTTCSSPQNIPGSNGHFVEYSASFSIPPDAPVTASLNLAVNDFAPQYFAGIGVFKVSPA